MGKHVNGSRIFAMSYGLWSKRCDHVFYIPNHVYMWSTNWFKASLVYINAGVCVVFVTSCVVRCVFLYKAFIICICVIDSLFSRSTYCFVVVEENIITIVHITDSSVSNSDSVCDNQYCFFVKENPTKLCAVFLRTVGVCVIEYFTAESNRLVALGGTIYSFSK